MDAMLRQTVHVVWRRRPAHGQRGPQPRPAPRVPQAGGAGDRDHGRAVARPGPRRGGLHRHGVRAAERHQPGALRGRELCRAPGDHGHLPGAGAGAHGDPGRRQGRLGHHGRAGLDEGDGADRRPAHPGRQLREAPGRAEGPGGGDRLSPSHRPGQHPRRPRRHVHHVRRAPHRSLRVLERDRVLGGAQGLLDRHRQERLLRGHRDPHRVRQRAAHRRAARRGSGGPPRPPWCRSHGGHRVRLFPDQALPRCSSGDWAPRRSS